MTVHNCTMESILIAFATRFGATSKTAMDIKQILEKNNINVDVLDLDTTKSKNWPDLMRYDGLILGSGIKMGKWKKQATNYLKKNKDYLVNNSSKISIFVSCGTAAEKPKIDQAKKEYLTDFFSKNNLPQFHAEAFSGIFDFSEQSRFGFLEKKLMKAGAKNDMDPDLGWDFEGLNDFRDPARIEQFTMAFLKRIRG